MTVDGQASDYDVVVVGGGAAGLAAALGSARCGARTLLVERYGFLGGAATNAQVLSYCGFYKETPAGPEQTVRGVGEELLAELRALGMDTSPTRSRSGNWIILLDPEAVKLGFDRLALRLKFDVHLHSLLVSVQRDGERLSSLCLADHTGIRSVRARAFVDASGEATLACLAGVPLGTDSATGSHVQPASACIRIGGVPPGTVIDRARLASLIAAYNRGRADEGLTRPDGGVLVRLPDGESLWSMVVDLKTDGLTASDLTRAEMHARALAWDMVQLMRRVPGCERAHLLATGPQLGIRETRRPCSVEDVHAGDVLSGRLRPAQSIARGSWPMEVHEAPGKVRFVPVGGRGHYDIAHHAIMARGLVNLRLAGRVIGADADAYGSTRVMGTAFATGHAAGVSAALHQEGKPADCAAIRRALQQQGALL